MVLVKTCKINDFFFYYFYRMAICASLFCIHQLMTLNQVSYIRFKIHCQLNNEGKRAESLSRVVFDEFDFLWFLYLRITFFLLKFESASQTFYKSDRGVPHFRDLTYLTGFRINSLTLSILLVTILDDGSGALCNKTYLYQMYSL